MVTFITGWVFLISSWIVPYFIKDKSKKYATGAILSAIATGLFVGRLLDQTFGVNIF